MKRKISWTTQRNLPASQNYKYASPSNTIEITSFEIINDTLQLISISKSFFRIPQIAENWIEILRHFRNTTKDINIGVSIPQHMPLNFNNKRQVHKLSWPIQLLNRVYSCFAKCYQAQPYAWTIVSRPVRIPRVVRVVDFSTYSRSP